MLFISLGKSVAGADDKSNAIKYKNLEIRTNSVVVILVASLVTAVLPLLLQFYTLINLPPTPPNDATAKVTPHGVVPPNETLEGAVSAEARCKSLKGLYRLYGDYDFVRTGNIKATVRSSTWDANTCKEGKDGSYVLRGRIRLAMKLSC